MSATQRSAYDTLSANNKNLVDTDIAMRFHGAKVSDDVSLGRWRERGANDIETLLRSKTTILKQARALNIKPTNPIASFPPELAAQVVVRTR